MAGPLAGISAAEIAQKKLQEQGAPQKQGPSKFDAALSKSEPAGKPAPAHGVDEVSKAEGARLNKAQDIASQKPPTVREVSKSAATLSEMLSGIERGQGVMDKLIKAGVSGYNFSSSELLALQASMYRYTQELELTGKVVEKATTGLKDTLKTQV